MSWTGFPIPQSTDWLSLLAPSFYNQFPAAIREREQLLNVTGSEVITLDGVAGDYVASVSGGLGFPSTGARITQMQERIEGICYAFGTPAMFPVGDDVTVVAQSGPDVGTYDLATFRAAAGLHADGFTRKYPDGMGGVTVAHGIGQAGDYIGPWIFEELKMAISTLHTIRVPYASSQVILTGLPHVATWDGLALGPFPQPAPPATTHYGGEGRYTTSPHPNFDEAWDLCEADWAEDNAQPILNPGVSLYYAWTNLGTDHTTIRAEKESTHAYFSNVASPAGLTRSVEAVYHNPRSPTGQAEDFRALGTGLVDGWNDVTADIAVTPSGTDFGSGEYYPAADDITLIPPPLHESEAVAPGGGGYRYGFDWSLFAGYIKYTGFTYP